MANKNFNTQIRKKFDKGSSPIKRGGLNFKTPAQKSHEKLKKQFNPSDYNITSAGGTKKPGKQIDKNPGKNMSDKDKADAQRAAERRRQFKRKNKKTEDRQPKQPIEKPPLKKEPLRKSKKNTIKDKLNKVGNMKVKDAATAVAKATYKGALAGTPIGAAKNVTNTFKKNFKFQSPIVRKNKKFGGR